MGMAVVMVMAVQVDVAVAVVVPGMDPLRLVGEGTLCRFCCSLGSRDGLCHHYFFALRHQVCKGTPAHASCHHSVAVFQEGEEGAVVVAAGLSRGHLPYFRGGEASLPCLKNQDIACPPEVF